MWKVIFDNIEQWMESLDRETLVGLYAATNVLSIEGPTLGRPLVDTIAGSNIKNLKELRPPSPGRTEIRVLFVFDPSRNAILLTGGDKSGEIEKGGKQPEKWEKWYRTAIPEAERILEEYLKSTYSEGKQNGGDSKKSK